jgi:hypothetical protein
MSTLTRAELAHYPGNTPTERALAHHAEAAPAVVRPKTLGRLELVKAPRAQTVALPRELDLRPFPGRDRGERIANWIIAHVPRAETWSRESLRELADRIATTSSFLE